MDEVGAAHDFGYRVFAVVHGAGELVAGDVVATPDEEVAEVAAGDGGLGAEEGVGEGDGFVVGHAEAPVVIGGEVEGRPGGIGRGAPDGGEEGFVGQAGFVGGAGGGGDFAAGAGAGVEGAGGVEVGESGAVGGEALALVDDGLLPGEAKPGEIG